MSSSSSVRKSTTVLLVILTVAAGCALIPEPREVPPDPGDLDAFTERVRASLESHDWQAILAVADPDHYRIRVAEGRAQEPRFLAELFGLTRAPNTIQEGDTLTWADWERIATVTLQGDGEVGGGARLVGTATLESGETLRLEAHARPVRGRLVLTVPEADPAAASTGPR